MIRILLADDHNIVRRGLVALLQLDNRYAVVAEAANGEEALEQAAKTPADVAILDLAMPRLNGIETAHRLKRQLPNLKIVMLSMYDDNEFVTQALNAGALGYVLKASLEDELFTALESVLNDQQFISASVGYQHQLGHEMVLLTGREREVLQLIAEGHTTNQISELMGISPHTASRHRANLMKKLNTHTQAGLVRNGIERGLIVIKRPAMDNTPDATAATHHR